jgi:hypothetical protein
MRWAGGFERRGGRGGAALIGSTVWAGLWPSCHCQVCLRYCVLTPFAHEKGNARKTRGKGFLFFYFLFHERFLLFIFFLMKDFSFL